MAKLRVSFEVDTNQMFDTLAKVNDGGNACASRLIEPLLTGHIGWADAVGLGVYGIEFKGSERLDNQQIGKTWMDIRPEDLKVEVARRNPPGGQHVGTETGVRITHLPTGLTAECKTERSQHRNRSIAMDMILGGLTSPHFRG